MKNILITGGAGYIGSKLATELLNYNYKVTVIDVLKFSSRSLNHLFNNKNFSFGIHNLFNLLVYNNNNDCLVRMTKCV